MALKHWLFVYSAPGLPDGGKVDVVDSGACRTVLAGFPSASSALAGLRGGGAVASELERAQLVELCGAFGASHVSVLEAHTKGRVPIGLVTYTGDMTTRLHALFAHGNG
jgi:Family of unknown function (DUF6506)